MEAFDTWESYFYPERYVDEQGYDDYPPTLRNLKDVRDPYELQYVEHAATARRGAELSAGLVSVERTYDAAHLRAIHRHLFQDVYAWAGEYRTVNITKGRTDFASVVDGSIDRRLQSVHSRVEAVDWSRLGQTGFAEHASAVFAELNIAHPFREGNGRTAKLFMEHVADQSPFELNWAAVSPAVWNQRSEFSAPDPAMPGSPAGWDTHPEHLYDLFQAIATQRSATAMPAPAPEARGLRRLLGSSYPRPAQDATQQPSTARVDAGRRTAGYDGRGDVGRSL